MNGNTKEIEPGLPAREFENIFRKAGVLADGLDGAKSAASKATRIGKFLAPNVGREVTISVNGRTGKAKLCMNTGRAKQKLYYFEVRWDDPDDNASGTKTASVQVELDDGLDAPGSTNTVMEATKTVQAAVAGTGRDQQKQPTSAGNEEQW